jgi:ribonucleoside-diphosphate reductase alpha chain
MKDYQKVIAVSKYARWLEKENRRETWGETVERYCDNVLKSPKINKQLKEEIRQAIYNLDVMPSMRALMTAGPALDRCNVAGYNCSYLPIDNPRSFDELMYILMCGTGAGFSVERTYTDKLPIISEHFEKSNTKIVVGDSKAGWARSFKELLALLYSGQVPEIDYSLVRPEGSRLKVFGGRASGPGPLKSLFDFCIDVFKNAAGRKLRPIECHDICCKIAEVIVSGGVRRSALISLSDVGDHEMAMAKTGQWWMTHPHRALSNNSAVYNEKPPIGQFLSEWNALYNSKSGERGIFNRQASYAQALKNGRRKVEGVKFGTNPCSEIILRPYQFCNLSEVVCRAEDTLETLKNKVELATIIGTVQSTLTNFKYLRKIWKDNCEEERLLGVSMTGVFDNMKLFDNNWQDTLKQHAVEVNKKWANIFGINQSTAITCIKPSGSVSQLVDSASGIHPRHNKYYIRSIRGDNFDPMTEFLKNAGVPNEPNVMSPNKSTVFYFPQKAPDGALVRHDLSAIRHLEYWLQCQREWCEHKPSVTINVAEDEWVEVAAFVYKHFDEITGVAFLPRDDPTYEQAPYQDIDEETYNKWIETFPKNIDWSNLPDFETEDTTKGSQELACVAGDCSVTEM